LRLRRITHSFTLTCHFWSEVYLSIFSNFAFFKNVQRLKTKEPPSFYGIIRNLIGGEMVSALIISSVVDGGFEPRLGQTKDYKIGTYCFLR
jgi:hypothetical protein